MKIINKYTKNVISRNAKCINKFLNMISELLNKDDIEHDDALIIAHCKKVSRYFAKKPIDVLFVDNSDMICYIEENLQPWQKSKFVEKAKYVIELPAGRIREKKLMVNGLLKIMTEAEEQLEIQRREIA